MTHIKTFDYKGQMINYYNKIKSNPKIDFAIGCFSAETCAWTIYYNYKKN